MKFFLFCSLALFIQSPALAKVFREAREISMNTDADLIHTTWEWETSGEPKQGWGETCVVDDEALKCWAGEVSHSNGSYPSRINEDTWKLDLLLPVDANLRINRFKMIQYAKGQRWKCLSLTEGSSGTNSIKCLRRLPDGRLQIKNFSQLKPSGFGYVADSLFNTREPSLCIYDQLNPEIGRSTCWKINAAGEFTDLENFFVYKGGNDWDESKYKKPRACELAAGSLLCASPIDGISESNAQEHWVLKTNSSALEEWEVQSFYAIKFPENILGYEVALGQFCVIVQNPADLKSLECWDTKTLAHTVVLSAQSKLELYSGLVVDTLNGLKQVKNGHLSPTILENFCFEDTTFEIRREICWSKSTAGVWSEQVKFIEPPGDWFVVASDQTECRYNPRKQVTLCAGQDLPAPLTHGVNYNIKDQLTAKLYAKKKMACILEGSSAFCWLGRSSNMVRAYEPYNKDPDLQPHFWKTEELSEGKTTPFGTDFCNLETDHYILCWSAESVPGTDTSFGQQPPPLYQGIFSQFDFGGVSIDQVVREEDYYGKSTLCFYDKNVFKSGFSIKKKICGYFADDGFKTETRQILEPNLDEFKNISYGPGISCGHYQGGVDCWTTGDGYNLGEYSEFVFKLLREKYELKSIALSGVSTRLCITSWEGIECSADKLEDLRTVSGGGRGIVLNEFGPLIVAVNEELIIFMENDILYEISFGPYGHSPEVQMARYNAFDASKILEVEKGPHNEVCFIDEFKGVKRKSCGDFRSRVSFEPPGKDAYSAKTLFTLKSLEILSPDLNNFTEQTSVKGFYCGVYQENHYCWSDGSSWESQELLEKYSDFGNVWVMGAAADGDLNCLGSMHAVLCNDLSGFRPQIKFLKALFTMGDVVCAIDAEGVKCWNQTGVRELPGFNVLMLEKGLNDLSSVSPPVKSKFYSQLSEFIQGSNAKDSWAQIKENLILRRHILDSIGLIVNTSDSQILIEKIMPLYEIGIAGSKAIFDSANIKSDDEITVQSRASIKLLQLALSLALEFYSIDEQKILSELLPIVGVAYAAPGDRQKISALIEALDQKQTLLDLRKSSVKTEFLIRLIEQEREWLRGVIL